jgi:hypothetical protein
VFFLGNTISLGYHANYDVEKIRKFSEHKENDQQDTVSVKPSQSNEFIENLRSLEEVTKTVQDFTDPKGSHHWRNPGFIQSIDRLPTPEEAAAEIKYLEKQIENEKDGKALGALQRQLEYFKNLPTPEQQAVKRALMQRATEKRAETVKIIDPLFLKFMQLEAQKKQATQGNAWNKNKKIKQLESEMMGIGKRINDILKNDKMNEMEALSIVEVKKDPKTVLEDLKRIKESTGLSSIKLWMTNIFNNIRGKN